MVPRPLGVRSSQQVVGEQTHSHGYKPKRRVAAVSSFCFELISFSYGQAVDVGIMSSEATVVVLQFSRVTGGVGRLEHGVLLNNACSTKRSDNTIIVGRASTSGALSGRRQRMNIFFNFRPILIPCFMCKSRVWNEDGHHDRGGGERDCYFA